MTIEHFGKYRIDASYAEHGCCWGSAIVCNCSAGMGIYGSNVDLILECNSEMAEEICNALNTTLT